MTGDAQLSKKYYVTKEEAGKNSMDKQVERNEHKFGCKEDEMKD